MKRFKTLAETKEFMDGVLYRVGNIIRAHRYLPDNVSTLEYLYMAMAEYIDPESSARDNLCDEFPLPDLMRGIAKMSTEDILGVAAICKAFRIKHVKRGDIEWNFNVDHGCRYAETIRAEYYNILHATVVAALKRISDYDSDYDCDDEDEIVIDLHDVLDKISVDVWVPELVFKDGKSATVMVHYIIHPFTGESDCVDDVYEGNYNTGFYVGMIHPINDVIDPGVINPSTVQIPDISQAYACVRTARSYVDSAMHIRVNHNPWISGFGDIFPLTMNGVSDDFDTDLTENRNFYYPWKRGNAACTCNKLDNYSYYDFLSDVFLYVKPDVWVIGFVYMLLTTKVERGYASYMSPNIDHMTKSGVVYCSKRWAKSCQLYKHSKSVLWLLATLDINTPVKSNDLSGWVNLRQREYELTKKFTGSF